MRLQIGWLLASLALTAACAGSGDDGSGAPGGAAGKASGGAAGSGTSPGGTAQAGTNGGGASGDGNPSSSGSNSGGTPSGGSAAGGSSGSGQDGGAGNGDIQLPPANAGFDYQIGGAYTPPAGVKVVSRDRGDAPAPGLYNICYVNGFQAQQADDDWWNTEHPELVLRDAQGDPVIDPDWDEMLLDTSTPEKRQALAEIVGGWIQGCGTQGYDAIEIDNLDSYSRSGGKLSQANNVAFMKLLSDIGHQAGLAMGQKNSTELVGKAKEMSTDFAVAEECNRYSECADYKSGYGDLVFVIEYRDQDFAAGCKDFPELSIVRRDVDVSPPGAAGYAYEGC